VDLTLDLEVVRAAALGCLFAAFMAEQLGYVAMATELLTAAAILREVADTLERRAAARKPAPRIARARPATDPLRAAPGIVPLAASVGASGGVLALPALRVDTSALVAAIGGLKMDAALTASVSASLAAMGKTFADALANSLQPTIDAMLAAHAESARRMVDQMARSWAFKFPATATVRPA
jgi:hypothetical protein